VRYLVDTSALVRIVRRQAEPHWYDAVDRGLVALCQPVIVEMLTGVSAKDFDRINSRLRDAYPWVSVPDGAWSTIEAIQQELAGHGQHHGLSVADHLVVATAMRLKLTVLHADADFETVSRLVPQLRQERITGKL
jgi:predicted nucleic acid-binding protein